jgi:predicted DNA-binding protein YlxM (UPF0122 family)
MYYRMTYDAFNNLILSLTSHLQIILFESFQATINKKRIVAIIIYMFVHGYSVTHMAYWFNVDASTIRKYVDIVVDVLANVEKVI